MCQTLAGVNWHRLWWSCSGLIQLSICPLVLKKLTILCTKNTVIFLLPFSPFLTYISHQFYFPGEHISGQQISRLHHFLDSNPRPSFFFLFFFSKAWLHLFYFPAEPTELLQIPLFHSSFLSKLLPAFLLLPHPSGCATHIYSSISILINHFWFSSHPLAFLAVFLARSILGVNWV